MTASSRANGAPGRAIGTGGAHRPGTSTPRGSEYDNVGNVWRVIDPRKNATADTGDYTTLYEYDKAHRVTKVTDALGNTTETIPDPLGKPKQVEVPHKNDNGTITCRITEYEYDQVGNQIKVTSPRGTATPNPDDFTWAIPARDAGGASGMLWAWSTCPECRDRRWTG
jgi:YD repeat-containing protein